MLYLFSLAFVGVKNSKILFGRNKVLSLKAHKVSFKPAGKIIEYLFNFLKYLYFQFFFALVICDCKA